MPSVERAAAFTRLTGYADKAHIVTWTGLLDTDTGAPIDMVGAEKRSIQFTGTFGVNGTIVIEGSNDGTNYVTLTDPQGNAVSKTAAAVEQIEELTRFIRPRVSVGDANTSLTATLLVRRII